MVHNLVEMTKQIAKSWETHIVGIIGLLIASNAYFVQRVISQVDITTSQVSQLREQLGRVETKLENLIVHRWKK